MFTQTDFRNATISYKLNAVVMDRMDYCCTKQFKSLTSLSKKNKYNEILNTYIDTFDEDWVTTLDRDFNNVMSLHMSQDGFRPENETCLHVNSTPVLME